MHADPYSCSVCDVTFPTEKESYEHDISLEHHRRLDNSKQGKKPKIHHCSICDVGGMIRLGSWISHVNGKRHRKTLQTFHDYYKNSNTNHPQLPIANPKAFEKPGSTASVREAIPSIKDRESTTISPKIKMTIPGDTIELKVPIMGGSSVNDNHSQLSIPDGGLMLNILEAVKSAPPDTVNPPTDVVRVNGQKNSMKPQPHMDRRDRINTHHSKSTRRKRQCPPESNDPCYSKPSKRQFQPKISKTAKASIRHWDTDSPNRTSKSSKASKETSHLQRMQEALEVSRELEAVITDESRLEIQLRKIQRELVQAKSKKKELKLRRAVLLSVITYSESDDEHEESGATGFSHTSHPSSNERLVAERQIASVAPVNSVSRVSKSSSTTITSSTSMLSRVNPCTPTSIVYSSSIPYCPPSSESVTLVLSDSNDEMPHTSAPTQITELSIPETVSKPTPQNDLVLSTAPQLESVPTSGGGGLDLQRLSLIRQALQSPDSWQFTFENVDRMLQATAARVAASSTSLDVTGQSDAIATPVTASSVSAPEHHSVPQLLPVEPASSEAIVEPVTIKGEPVSPEPIATDQTNRFEPLFPPTSANPAQISQEDLNPSPAKSSSSSLQSQSKTEQSSGHTQLVKPDPSQQTNSSNISSQPMSDRNPPVPPQQPVKVVDPDPSSSDYMINLKKQIKPGEFHAFDDLATAVIDMLVHYSSSSIIIGGQNGSVVQYSLKTHERLKKFASRDASVTRMVLTPQQRSIFVGYYDNYLAEYDVQFGSLLFEKSFINRIESLAVAPSLDVPFVYLGMSNGDILRHHIVDGTSSVIYQYAKVPKCAISSIAVVRCGHRFLLIIGDHDCYIVIRDASDGSLLRCITASAHRSPPEGIRSLHIGPHFCSYSERALRIHNWKTGAGILTIQTQKITSFCVMERHIALGDSEGSIRLYKISQENGLPSTRPAKVYYANTRAAITSLTSSSIALISGSLDGTVTVIWVTEPVNNYICLYGPFGQNCGIGFDCRKDLITHVMDAHLIFGNQKSVMCRWGGGRCRTRFTDTQSIRAISDHLLTHIPD